MERILSPGIRVVFSSGCLTLPGEWRRFRQPEPVRCARRKSMTEKHSPTSETELEKLSAAAVSSDATVSAHEND